MFPYYYMLQGVCGGKFLAKTTHLSVNIIPYNKRSNRVPTFGIGPPPDRNYRKFLLLRLLLIGYK